MDMTLSEWFETQSFPAEDENLASSASLYLKKGAGRSLKSGGGWVYDNEVDRTEGSFDNGAILKILDFDGFPLGYGFINTASRIRVRMLSRYEKNGITPAFLRQRVRDAWTYRKAVIDTDSCRVLFGEADFLPGLTVDKFGDVLVVESLALGTEPYKVMILNMLADAMAEDGIRIRGIYERSDAKVRQLEGLPRTKGFIGPEFDTNVPIVENGVRYLVDVKDGQKTGFFLDQKNNRAAVAGIVRRLQTPSVLDCFTHTGSFGLNCALAGAGSVLSVDASDLAIHGLSPRLLQMEDCVPSDQSAQTGFCYLTADVFDLLPKLEAAGRQYDIVILDPPAFTKSRQVTKNAVKGYREINLRGMRLVKDGGFLATCSCSHFDHPILWGDDESYYLKFLIFQVIEER